MADRPPRKRTRSARAKSLAVAPRAEESPEARLVGLESLLARREGAALAQSLYHTIVTSVLDPTITIDAWGRIVIASNSVERVFGWSPQYLRGRNIRKLMPEPHRGAHDQYLENWRRTGKANILGMTREFEVVHRDGRLIPCELSVSRTELPDAAGTFFTGSFRDISLRKAAERALRESEARFHAIFEHSFQYMGLLAADGTMLEANQTALHAAGITREDVIGKPFWETRWWSVSAETKEQCRRAVRAAGRGEFVRMETEHRGTGDDIRSIDFSLKPVRDIDGKVVTLIPEGRDVTELKRAQRAETSMLRALATIGESAAVLAHEIKNPITAVNLALRAVADQLGQDHKSVLEDLVSRMQRLEQLMRRTLSFSRPLHLRLVTVAAREVLEEVERQMRPEVELAGAKLSVRVPDAPLEFSADRHLLEEVLTNLVRNALEAGSRGVSIEVAARRGKRRVHFTVDDDGPGIPESVRATLFKPFSTTKAQGTGLGLAFSRKVIEEHGGSLVSQDSPLGGARFAIELPVN